MANIDTPSLLGRLTAMKGNIRAKSTDFEYSALPDAENAAPALTKTLTASVEEHPSSMALFWQHFARPVGAVAVYYFIGYVFYHFHRGWTFIDCAYFSTVLMTTVGYGDQVPHSDMGLIFTAAYAMLAFTLVATAVSRLLDWHVLTKVMEHQEQKRNRVKQQLEVNISELSMKKRVACRVQKLKSVVRRGFFSFLSPASLQVSLLDEESQRQRRRRMMLGSIGLYVFWLAIGTIANASMQDLPDEDWDGSRLIKGFYFSVVTLTTVGFGDFVPASSAGKLFDIFYIIVGVPICVHALSQIVEAIWGADDEVHNIDLVHGLNGKKLQTMLDFQKDMAKAGCGNEVDNNVSRYEFLLFILTQNGIVEMDMITQIMDNFRALDESNNGFLDMSDVSPTNSTGE